MEEQSAQGKARRRFALPAALAWLPRMANWAGRCRVLLYLLAGLMLLDGVVTAKRRLWQAYDPDDYLERLAGCRRGRHDLVCIGGSPVSEGLDTSVLEGLTWRGRALTGAFNLGLPGATTSDCWHALRHGVSTPPRLLVYGITASDLNDSRGEPHGCRVLMDVHDVLASVRTRPGGAVWCLRNFAQGQLSHLWQLYRYRNGIRLWAADKVDRLWPGTCPDAALEARAGLRDHAALQAASGYAPHPTQQVSRLDLAKATGVPLTFPFLENFHLGGHLAYVHRIIHWARDNGTEVVLVDMPVSGDLEERRSPQVFALYHQVLADVERAEGVRVIRASRAAVGLGDEDFADLVHLNAQGSARFSRWLRRQLEEPQ